MTVTIKDVAKEAGVSIATVSRIINKQAGYGKMTEQNVLAAIKQLGYTPNALARGLVGRETKTIGVIMPKVSGLFSAKLLEGIDKEARRRGFSVFVSHTQVNEGHALKDLQVFREKQVDGVIYISDELTPPQEDLLMDMKVPVILVATRSLRMNFPYVKVDDEQAMYDGTTYLIDQGHREIAFIGGENNDAIAGGPRDRGFRRAMADATIPVNELLIYYGNYQFESGVDGLHAFLASGDPFTAVATVSDETAIGVLSACWTAGLSVPEDVSVLGYDNTKAAVMAIPPLTTISQPLDAMGGRAVEQLLKLREHEEYDFKQTETPHSLSTTMLHQLKLRETIKRINREV
ncbi:LacI family DNA-binding transcriptional regulator [Salisediminibacterium beveridgei]|uniref:Catabolite control protein A n=1 Tax=Salisediminibacterium beveridgei TaxID=632773 RepID=A0A1D7QU80_9BACI|nr:LacI family DNA-binding transcriptional regulator [Salisediminibacterium beveridgei]AOM82518.1 Catabolite control protein A [Salisediminibacterium beveridgei]